MNALYTAFAITWFVILSYTLLLIRARSQLNRELLKLNRLQ
ncbi:MAG: CcmD family protein [Methanosarcinaceae archaeon]|nr:CcmD family protein [Methanosarcinaceae archaeon]